MSAYAVLGDPIQHSLSPRIFKLFAEQTQQVLDYQAIQVKVEALPAQLIYLRQQGYKGVNLTAPLKEAALLLAEACSPVAQAAKAINLLSFREDGSSYGDNSDGIGFIRDLTQAKGYSLQDKTVLILGAGGAVRGIMASLLKAGPRQVFIANRSEAKAHRLIADFQETSRFCAWQEIHFHRFDVIIHCTTAGVQGERLPLPSGILNPGACCYDLSYGKNALPFLSWAKEQAAACSYDGLGMLVEQAAEAFYVWCQQRVATEPILRQLRQTPVKS